MASVNYPQPGRAEHDARAGSTACDGDEVQNILRAALVGEAATSSNLAEGICRCFQPFGGVGLPVHLREPIRDPPEPGRGHSPTRQ